MSIFRLKKRLTSLPHPRCSAFPCHERNSTALSFLSSLLIWSSPLLNDKLKSRLFAGSKMPGGVAPLGHGKRDGARRRQVLAQRGRRKRWEGTEGAKRPEPSGRLTPGKGSGSPFAASRKPHSLREPVFSNKIGRPEPPYHTRKLPKR